MDDEEGKGKVGEKGPIPGRRLQASLASLYFFQNRDRRRQNPQGNEEREIKERKGETRRGGEEF